jgi:hypothetical protein
MEKKLTLELTEKELEDVYNALWYAYTEKYRNIPGEKVSIVLDKLIELKKKIVS